MKATIRSVGEYGKAGVFRLNLLANSNRDFGCTNAESPIEVTKRIGDIRREFHNELDIAIDAALAAHLKSKFKRIE